MCTLISISRCSKALSIGLCCLALIDTHAYLLIPAACASNSTMSCELQYRLKTICNRTNQISHLYSQTRVSSKPAIDTIFVCTCTQDKNSKSNSAYVSIIKYDTAMVKPNSIIAVTAKRAVINRVTEIVLRKRNESIN